MQGSVVGFVGVAKGRVVAVSTAAWDLLREIYRHVHGHVHAHANKHCVITRVIVCICCSLLGRWMTCRLLFITMSLYLWSLIQPQHTQSAATFHLWIHSQVYNSNLIVGIWNQWWLFIICHTKVFPIISKVNDNCRLQIHRNLSVSFPVKCLPVHSATELWKMLNDSTDFTFALCHLW